MKTLINIIIVAMFGIEICSPFFIGYLNQKVKHTAPKKNKDIVMKEEIPAQKTSAINWKTIDFTGNNYSDSKTYTIKE